MNLQCNLKFTVVLLSSFFLVSCFCYAQGTDEVDVVGQSSIQKKDISEIAGKSESIVSPYFLTVVYAVLFIIGGIVVYVLYKKKMLSGFGPLNSNKNIKIVETSMLGNRQFLVLAECEDKRVLLGVGPGFINKLIDYPSNMNDDFTKTLEKQLESNPNDV